MSEHSSNCTCMNCEADRIHMYFYFSKCTDTMQPKPGILYKMGCPCFRCVKTRADIIKSKKVKTRKA